MGDIKWTEYHRPTQDERGWHYIVRDTQTGTETRHDFPDEASCRAAQTKAWMSAALAPLPRRKRK